MKNWSNQTIDQYRTRISEVSCWRTRGYTSSTIPSEEKVENFESWLIFVSSKIKSI